MPLNTVRHSIHIRRTKMNGFLAILRGSGTLDVVQKISKILTIDLIFKNLTILRNEYTKSYKMVRFKENLHGLSTAIKNAIHCVDQSLFTIS